MSIDLKTLREMRGVARIPVLTTLPSASELVANPAYQLTPQDELYLWDAIFALNPGVSLAPDMLAEFLRKFGYYQRADQILSMSRDASGITRFDRQATHHFTVVDVDDKLANAYPSIIDREVTFLQVTAELEDPAVPLPFAGEVKTGIPWLPSLPCGLTILIGRGGVGKTPILRSIATKILPIEEADRPSNRLEDLPLFLKIASGDPKFKARPIFGIDSLRNVLRTAGGNAETGGFATGAQVFLTDVNSVAMSLGIAIVAVINPNSKSVKTLSQVYEMATDLDNGVAGVIVSASPPVEVAGKWRAMLDIGLRAPLGKRITSTPNTTEVIL